MNRKPGKPFDPQRSVSLFQLAGAFEEAYRPLVGMVTEESGIRFYDWTGVLAEAGWLIESMEKEFRDLLQTYAKIIYSRGGRFLINL